MIEAVIDTYRRERGAGERFIDTVRRLGLAPFKRRGRRGAPHHRPRAADESRHMKFIDPQRPWHASAAKTARCRTPDAVPAC